MPKYTYHVAITNQYGESLREYTTSSLAAARVRLADVTIGGAYPDRIVFDHDFESGTGEMCVYGELTTPALRNASQIIGIITREEVE